MNNLNVHLDDASEHAGNPEQSDFDAWAKVFSAHLESNASLCLKIVSTDEMSELNERFRGKQGTSNVLSFAVDETETELHKREYGEQFLGDIAICAEVVQHESKQQGKNSEAHWTHLFFHGVLHLLGYDHQNDQEAELMEALETSLLAELQIAAPYQLVKQASTS